MTIRKGEPWGSPVIPGDLDAQIAPGDASLAELAAATPNLVARVAGGDLHRTLGLPESPRPDPQRFPVDLGWVALDDGQPIPFVAHVIARRVGWLGFGAVAMNAAWLSDLYLGPRAHPNDGLLDITWGHLPLGQLLVAKKRAQAGTHLPHPELKTRRAATWEHQFARPIPVRVDAEPRGRARSLRIWINPDAFVVVG